MAQQQIRKRGRRRQTDYVSDEVTQARQDHERRVARRRARRATAQADKIIRMIDSL